MAHIKRVVIGVPGIVNVTDGSITTKSLANGAVTLDNIAPGVIPTYDTPGYDVVLLAGQSNMSGRGTPIDLKRSPSDSRIMQYAATGSYADVISVAEEPLGMHDTPTGIGPGIEFARWWLTHANPDRRVLLVPAAHGGTPLSSNATLGWRPGVSGNLYAQAIAQTNAALAAAGPGARLIGILWLQGETDGDNNVTAATYQADLDALIAGFRAEFGNPRLPFVLGSMVPEYLSTGTRAAIDEVHQTTPSRVPYTITVAAPIAMNKGDGNHYNLAGNLLNGRRMYEGLRSITMRGNPTVNSIGVTGALAVQAYSAARVVHSTYFGPLVRVRRSSDDAVLDIPQLNGELDTDALLSFVGSGDGFVVRWYDQSGNGRHVFNDTASAQPRIVIGGVLQTLVGKPAIAFDGSNDFLTNTTPVLWAAGAATVLAVLSATPASSATRWWAESILAESGHQYGLAQSDKNTMWQYGVPVVTAQDGGGFTSVGNDYGPNPPTHALFDGTAHQITAMDNGTAMYQWVDGIQDLYGYQYTRYTSTKDRFTIGGVRRSGTLAPMPTLMISEFVAFAMALGPTSRPIAYTNQLAYYGLGG